jgi:hypothetical protein
MSGKVEQQQDATPHRRLNIRKKHPTLYHSIMTLGVMSIALAINFWTSNPTFNPYNIPKNFVGTVFAVLGVGQFVFTSVLRDLRAVRLTLTASVFWMLFWGASNLEQSFAGKASYQLPILYIALAVLQIPLLIESPVNLTTEKK